jgi:tetratricopeptide (TPR) repeat protein
LATKKDRLIESAQKSLKKKQIAKAIKDYVRIVELDPADVRARQKLAELYVRTDKKAEAFEEYESVAKYFSGNGFYLKAIAIYKQMQRLDPGQISIFNRLAELNHKQGLLGNALAEYRNLVDYYARNGMVADELKTLEKMHELDPGNLNIRIKLAETYARNEHPEEGLAELDAILETLGEKGDFDRILKLYKMFMPLYPNNEKMQTGLALAFYEKGDYRRGVAILVRQLQQKPDDPDLLRLIGRGYLDLKDWQKAQPYYRQLLEQDPSDLDSREALIDSEIGQEKFAEALAELEEWKDAFFNAERLERLRGFYELLKNRLGSNRAVQETLDAIYELTGDGDKILDMISTREEEEDVDDEPVNDETLSDELLGSVETDIDAEAEGFELTDNSDELTFDVVEEESLDLQLEVDRGDDAPLTEEPGTDAILELDLDDADQPADQDGGFDLDFDLEEEKPSEETASEVVHNLQADLEEAEFYLQQGLHAEAEKLCRDILSYAPDSEECRKKLDEITALRQQDSGADSAAADVSSSDAGSVAADFSLDALRTDADTEKKVFKTDVDEQIAADDMESHYNLGIAYREMGLFEDAIGEFDKALKEPSRYVDCQTLKGLCYIDQGEYDQAEAMFREALASAYLEESQKLNLGYELGQLYQQAQRPEEALESYQQVFAQDSRYRDVAERIAQLKGDLGLLDVEVADDEGSRQRISFL